MKLSEELFKLVKSLSRREKSYFKRYSNLYSTNPDKQYLKLFSVLDKMKVYNEKKLRLDLDGEKLLKHLSHEKSYLYKLILRCLYSYDNADTEEKKLKSRCENIEVLISRRLFTGALKLLDKTLADARKSEHFSIWLELIKLKIKIYDYGWIAQATDEVRGFLEERARVMEIIQNLDEYIGLRFEVFDLQAEGFVDPENPTDGFMQLENHPLLKHPENALSKRALERYYYTINLFRFISRDFKSWHSGYPEYIFYVESNSILFQPQNFLQLYSNFLLACVKTRDKIGFYNTVEKYEKIIAHVPHEYAAHTAVMMSRKLDFHSETGEFKAGLIYYLASSEEVTLWYDKLPQFSKEVLLMGWIRTLLENMRFDVALDKIKLYHELDLNYSGSEYLVSRLFKSICHLELQQYSLLDTELRSIYRMLKKLQSMGPFESQFLRFLGKLPQAVNNKDVVPLLVNMRDELAEMAKDKSKNRIFEYFHIIPWLDSKIKSLPFHQMVTKYLIEDNSI